MGACFPRMLNTGGRHPALRDHHDFRQRTHAAHLGCSQEGEDDTPAQAHDMILTGPGHPLQTQGAYERIMINRASILTMKI